jgi:hypothetical protein
MHTTLLLDNLPLRPTYQADVFYDISAIAEGTHQIGNPDSNSRIYRIRSTSATPHKYAASK